PATPPPAPLRRPAAPLSMHPTGPHRELPSFPTRRSSDLGADDAGPHLAVGVLGAHGGKQRDAHKVFVPVDVVVALFHKKRLPAQDRKSTRLNSSHVSISYAVFCLKKKKTKSHHATARSAP